MTDSFELPRLGNSRVDILYSMTDDDGNAVDLHDVATGISILENTFPASVTVTATLESATGTTVRGHLDIDLTGYADAPDSFSIRIGIAYPDGWVDAQLPAGFVLV